MPRHRSTTLLACLLAGVLSSAVLPAVADPESALESAEERIAEAIAELRQIDAAREQEQAQLAAADENVRILEEELNSLLAAMQAQEDAVRSAEADAALAEAEAERIERAVASRARRAFINSTPTNFTALSGMVDGDVSGALDGIALLEALTARADASLETLGAARVVADTTAGRLEDELQLLEDVRATHERVLAEATEVLEERRGALRSLEVERERKMAEREELEEEAAEIQRIIDERAAAARRAAEEAARRAAEEEAARAAAEGGNEDPPTAAPPASGCYAWPANGRVTSEYGPRWGRMHAGLDIDGDTGDPLYAAQSGTVIYTGYYSGYGNLTLISHSDGVTTAYAHQSQFGVSDGQVVTRGEYIGRMGATGRVTGSHLHFETRTSSGTRNPRNYLC